VSLRRLALPLVALLLAGCGGQRGHGMARLWITRDRGSVVLFVGRVPAGLTAMQGLEWAAEGQVKTRYGGRFVQSIDGIQGSLSGERDWFYFVNGIEGDRSAAEYRLHPGDVEWWDYRSWRDAMSVPVVIGAFPEPFVHGFDGHRLRTVVTFGPGARRGAEAIARVVHGKAVPGLGSRFTNANVVRVDRSLPTSTIQKSLAAGGPVFLTLTPRDALRLARDPKLVEFRYQGVPQ